MATETKTKIPVSRRVKCVSVEGFHEVHYLDWGNASNANIMICVHGLSRNCRDFDPFAEFFSGEYRVVTVDLVGRGLSDRLANKKLYNLEQYIKDLGHVIAHVMGSAPENAKLTWVGSSNGGLCGMLLSSLARNPIQRLILNDIGPLVPVASLKRIAAYVGIDRSFATIEQAETFFRERYAGEWGPNMTSEHWRHIATHGTRFDEEKKQLVLSYDLGIAEAFKDLSEKDLELWMFWDKIKCPVLVLQGDKSDILSSATVERMTSSHAGGNCTAIVYPGTGHLPPLLGPELLDLKKWLSENRI